MFRRAVPFRKDASGRISVGLKRVPVGCNLLKSRGGSVMECMFSFLNSTSSCQEGRMALWEKHSTVSGELDGFFQVSRTH